MPQDFHDAKPHLFGGALLFLLSLGPTWLISMTEKISQTLTYFWASFVTFFGAFSINEIGVIIGIVLGIASFVVNLLHKRRIAKAIEQNVKLAAFHEKLDQG
ncbi:hypothetical protein BZJ19_10100 [Salinivibrio proteolyticus]|nr:hypothetical protein BZJ19_10100 [Salinivibrio proteolyticus]